MSCGRWVCFNSSKMAAMARVGIPDDKSLADAGCRFFGASVEVCPTGGSRDKEKLIGGKMRRQALVPGKCTCQAQIHVPRNVRLVG